MPPSPKFLEIAVPTPLRRTFHYLLPAGSGASDLQPGIRLSVPFGRQTLTGLLLGTATDTDVEVSKLKPAKAILDQVPVLAPSLLKLCLWAADYYHHPVGEVLATALPVLLRQGEPTSEPVNVLRTTEAGNGLLPAELTRAPTQAGLLRLLKTEGELTREDLQNAGISLAIARALQGKSLVEWITLDAPEQEPFDPGKLTVTPGVPLNDEQEAAVESIASGGPRPTLLFGITGSGKTEVYLELIERQLKAGRQALVLVPEIGLTPQTIRRFTHRFNVPVAVLHSGLTDRERLTAWKQARDGHAGIVIGTRSAIFTPLRAPGIIVIDEEHDTSFKQQDGFRYSARDLAVMRGHLEKVPVVLGSATPSLETWHNARSGKYGRCDLALRPGASMNTQYRIIDIRNEQLIEGFSSRLLDAIREHLTGGNQVLVFLNRRGYSPVLLCRGCGWIAQCHRCDARLTLHQHLGALICHHCGSQARISRACPECESDQLLPLGAGTQRLEEALAEQFDRWPLIRIDRDTTRTRDAMEKHAARIEKGEPLILVGTQMLAKGHHFPNVTLVAMIDMDAGFYSANFKAPERTAQLVLQVGGRAGRAEKPGTVAIQTHLPDQPIFRRLIDEGYARFADDLLAERETHELPPFHHQALIRAEATGKTHPLDFLENLAAKLAPHPSVSVLGPVPASMERKAGRYRAQLLLTAKNRKSLGRYLDHCIEIAEASPDARKVRWSVDVDPVDLF